MINKAKATALAGLVFLLASCTQGGTGSSDVSGGSHGKNTDNSFSMVTTWTSSGLVNHYNSNTSCEAFNYFVVEGMYRYVRSTDEVFCQLAAEMPTHEKAPIADYKDVMGEDAYDYYVEQGATEVTVTTAKIRENAKWQNGEDFVAKDVWAYYYMIHPTSSNYMAAVKVVDDKTVQYIWNPLKEPSDTAKELLIAQDKSGTVKYDVFASYVDTVYDIVMASPVNEDTNLWGAFNRFSTDEQISKMNITRSAFYSFSPSWYIATGPFKLQTFTATQILLVKNEFYWNAENIGFEKIKLYSSNDLNQTYQLISKGYISYYDGFIQQDVLQSMIDGNEDLINLKMYDPGSIGITFNTSKAVFTPEVREAFQYILDREEIMEAANPYGIVSYYPLMGMAESEAKTYMSEKHFAELPKFSHDEEKAATLLEEAGWTKESDGWHDTDGNLVSLKLGAPSSHDISSTASEAVAASLNAFGIKCDLLKSTNFYGTAADSNQYDLMLEWTDLNMSFSYPTGSYSQFSNFYSKWCKVERYPNNYPDTQKAGNVKLVFDGLDGDTNTYEFAEYINTFYSLKGDELTYMVDVFNTGLAKLNLGIQLFQNVTASTINVGHVKGVPLEDYWKVNRNVSYVPEVGTEDFYAVARTNLVFATGYLFEFGIYQPNN
jgi:peptide/nickel transport system substrate-binding protein